MLISLLNKANEEVLKVYKSPTRKALLDSQDVLLFLVAMDIFKGEERLLASNVLEEPIEGEGPLTKPRYTIKGVNKLNMVAYSNKDLDQDNDVGSNYLSYEDDIELETTNNENSKTKVEFSSIQPNAMKQLKKIYKQQT